MTDLKWLTLYEAAGLIRNKDLTSVELTEALLARVQEKADLDAFITLDADGALAAAEKADAAVSSGQDLGPLHGVPFALKDIIDAAGLPMTCHSKILQDNIAATDAPVTTKLKDAGGILLGKLATHEFAIGGPAFDLPFPPARNPWNRNYFPGGSSSGSGAAVSSGMAPLALGTDTGGSVRNPASCCGLAGMKATYGRVSRDGVFPLSYRLDHIGPLTRTVTDNALSLKILSETGPDPMAHLNQSVKGMKVGVLRHFYGRDLVADDDVTNGIEAALAVLQDLGAEIVEIEAAPLADYAACNRVILLSEAVAIHGAWLKERPQDYSALTRERLMPGLFFSAADYVNAMRWRRQLRDQMEAALSQVDVAITASSMDQNFRIDDPEAVAYAYPRQARTPFNLTGHPALALPVGFDQNGLPLSMQIVAQHWQEAKIYQAALAYETETGWHQHHPE